MGLTTTPPGAIVSQDGFTPLHLAVKGKHIKAICVLIVIGKANTEVTSAIKARRDVHRNEKDGRECGTNRGGDIADSPL